jgi:UDP-N-acetylglucosamine/UDP-N-acetylgalactosamine 4-epimerase
VNQLWERICQAVGTELTPEYVPSRTGDVRDSLASLALSEKFLGYRPQVNVEEGVRRTMDSLVAASA